MDSSTIIALSTPSGVGALAVIRLSGPEAIALVAPVFSKDLHQAAPNTVHFGTIKDNDKVIDEVVVTLFKAPHSFTKEDSVEISCHGSPYIVKQLIELFIRQGASYAKPGEFTQRAFMNGRFDLAQAEAVADLIASDSASAHQTALNQMRGGFSNEIRGLREQLVHFASMVELELDFAEEDVEFADRQKLKDLVNKINEVIIGLIDSFSYGNALKEGIPVAIVGKPNAGKSTLMNALLNEEKAIVTDIPGTTRDYIEDTFVLDGIRFRIIDTAGLRETTDQIEAEGVQRSLQQLQKAKIGLYLFDALTTSKKELEKDVDTLRSESGDVDVYAIGNKTDLGVHDSFRDNNSGVIWISAKDKTNLKELTDVLVKHSEIGMNASGTTVTNIRHYEGLLKTKESLDKVLESLDSGVTGDFVAMDIRQALHYLGEITGQITTDDLLENIFTKFCIGK